MLKKFTFVLREMKTLIKQHKLYFLAPLVITLAFLAVVFVKLGSGIIITFIYAGV